MFSFRSTLGTGTLALLLSVPQAGAPARASYPGGDGLIAFTKNGNIYTVTPTGRAARLVAKNGTKPHWSPDGRRLAMLRGGNVWVMKADGSAKSQVTRTGGAGALTWSPDGGWLAVVATSAATGSTALYKIRSTAPFGEPVTVTASHVENRPIAWSPDGASIAFNGGAFEGRFPCIDDRLVCISRVDIASGGVDVLTWTGGSAHSEDDIFAPDWKPDSSGILFSFVQTARDFSGDSTPLHVSVLPPSKKYTTDGGAYSPSGARVAFTKLAGGRDEIYTAKSDGSGWQRVTRGRDPDWQPVVS